MISCTEMTAVGRHFAPVQTGMVIRLTTPVATSPTALIRLMNLSIFSTVDVSYEFTLSPIVLATELVAFATDPIAELVPDRTLSPIELILYVVLLSFRSTHYY